MWRKEDSGCGNSERIASLTPWVSSAEQSYLAVQEEYLLEKLARQLGVVLGFFIAFCSRDEELFEMRK